MSMRQRSPTSPPRLLRFGAATLTALVSAGPLPAMANPIPRGSAGLEAWAFTARNRGPLAMTCTVETAHWYSVDLGTAGPGASITRRFWVSRPTGEIFILNAHRDRLPVETLWCGIGGRAWITRAAISLQRRAGHLPAPLRLECRSDDVLHCDAHPPRRRVDGEVSASFGRL